MARLFARTYLGALGLVLATLGGCAGIDYTAVSGPDTKGIRYYRPATYVLVMPDYEARKAKVTIFHGPDTSHAFAAQPYAYFASNKSKIEFQNGMLSQVTNETDATKLPSTMIQATVAVSKELLDALAKEKELAATLAKVGAAASLEQSAAKEAPRMEPPVFLFVADARAGLTQVYPPIGKKK